MPSDLTFEVFMCAQADYLSSMSSFEDCHVFNASSKSGGTFFFTSDRE